MIGHRPVKAYRARAEALVPMAWTDPWQPTHAQLEALVIEVAKGLGYLVHATHDSRTEHWAADSGWPDLFLLRARRSPLHGPRAIAIEVKVADDPSPQQRAWLQGLSQITGLTAVVLRSTGDRAHDLAAISALLQ